MLSSPVFWYTMLAVYVGASLWSFYKGFKKKRLKYALKQSVNGARIFMIIWVLYFALGAVSLIPPMTNWINNQNFSSDGRLVWAFAPAVYVLTVIYIMIRVAANIGKPLWKYTTQEQEWERESSLKFKTKVKSLLPSFLKRFVKTEKVVA